MLKKPPAVGVVDEQGCRGTPEGLKCFRGEDGRKEGAEVRVGDLSELRLKLFEVGPCVLERRPEVVQVEELLVRLGALRDVDLEPVVLCDHALYGDNISGGEDAVKLFGERRVPDAPLHGSCAVAEDEAEELRPCSRLPQPDVEDPEAGGNFQARIEVLHPLVLHLQALLRGHLLAP